jgi:hypothetical protein
VPFALVAFDFTFQLATFRHRKRRLSRDGLVSKSRLECCIMSLLARPRCRVLRTLGSALSFLHSFFSSGELRTRVSFSGFRRFEPLFNTVNLARKSFAFGGWVGFLRHLLDLCGQSNDLLLGLPYSRCRLSDVFLARRYLSYELCLLVLYSQQNVLRLPLLLPCGSDQCNPLI